MPAAKHILLARPDAIGDMVLTLPLAPWIKQHMPDAHITVLGRNYTRDVVACQSAVDAFVSLDDWTEGEAPLQDHLRALNPDTIVHALPHKALVKAAFQARIPQRIGTGRRWHTWGRLTHPHWFSRKKSDLHEAQLNLQLLSSLRIPHKASLDELTPYAQFDRIPNAPAWSLDALRTAPFNVVVHPGSRGSAADWPAHTWQALIDALAEAGIAVWVTGTGQEGEAFRAAVGDSWNPKAHDVTGKFTLRELIGFIAACDGLVAASTGPLHVAAASGIHAWGLYPTTRPMHAGRWAPLGPRVHVLESRSANGLDIPVETVAASVIKAQG